MARRILFYVQHLLGIGHLKRASAIARAAAEHGLEMVVASGGHPVPGVDFGNARVVQLPPVSAADGSFAVLLDQTGTPVDDNWRAKRTSRLLALLDDVRPDAVLIELFPFGRRQFRFELLPLLETVSAWTPRPPVICSVRDILVEKPKPERNREVAETVKRYFDAVLVHGDPGLIELDRTFPMAGQIADRIQYTGYVADGQGHLDTTENGMNEVIVSAGGGIVGESLLAAALAARPLSTAADKPWRFLTGLNLPNRAFDDLAGQTPGGVIVERHRADFKALLANCALSVSQGGYNTVMDVLRAAAKAVIVPFAAGQESEQSVRARLLASRGWIHMVEAKDLSPFNLAKAIDGALGATEPPTIDIKLDGAAETARLLRSLALNNE